MVKKGHQYLLLFYYRVYLLTRQWPLWLTGLSEHRFRLPSMFLPPQLLFQIPKKSVKVCHRQNCQESAKTRGNTNNYRTLFAIRYVAALEFSHSLRSVIQSLNHPMFYCCCFCNECLKIPGHQGLHHGEPDNLVFSSTENKISHQRESLVSKHCRHWAVPWFARCTPQILELPWHWPTHTVVFWKKCLSPKIEPKFCVTGRH